MAEGGSPSGLHKDRGLDLFFFHQYSNTFVDELDPNNC